MNDLNLVIIEGRAAREADLLYTKGGSVMCKFDIATMETVKDYEWNDKYITHFITVSFWEKEAERIASHLHKGDKIRITGTIRQNNWEDKDGNKRSDVYITGTNLDFLGE